MKNNDQKRPNAGSTGIEGSVLVVGSGIAGMQSALDLANAGYLVHMVTESSSIGGKMTQLDKTFPTNECAMCLLGPKMTDTLSHPNIDLYTCSTVERVEGEKGNFTIQIKKLPRYIDINECTACGDCENACPVSLPNEFNEDMGNRKAVYKLFPQAVPNKYLIEKRGTPPCRSTCPAGTNAQGYVALVSQGKFKEALEVVRRRMPFAGICGRICHHPCETECNRAQFDDPVAIALIKRAAFDFGWDAEMATPPAITASTRNEKVAIIGGGPAGLTAAQDLARQGFQVTVFEAQAEPGGMLRGGIPRYRLPVDVVQKETSYILGNGIEFRPNTRVGVDISFSELRSNYNAVVVAIGLQNSRMLSLPGSDLQGIVPGMEFLRAAAYDQPPPVGKKVAVIGGGNVAIDVARTAVRLGAEQVNLVCLETRQEMPAHEWEIEEAVDEGVIIHPSWGPMSFNGQANQITSLQLKRCISVFDAEGRFNPQYDDRTTKQLDVDMVIMAIGQSSDISFLANTGVEVNPAGGIVTDPISLSTTLAGVFACGDIATGPKSVVEAVASGHEVAESVRRYIDGIDLLQGRVKPAEEKLGAPPKAKPLPSRRLPQAMADVAARAGDFREVCLGYSPEDAMAEASRCLNCGICSECLQCEVVCKKNAVQHWQQAEVVELKAGAVVLVPGYELFEAELNGEYGYGVYENVMTSMEFERLLSSTGPTQGHVERPSDGKAPVRVAFIQCVGSRDCARDGSEYCSSICCMYSTKEAIIAREHDARIQPTVFYLDMRSYGKNFDKYVKSAENAGVRYVRTMISSLKEDPVTKNLMLQYLNGDKIVSEEFDLVVLAVGVKPPASAHRLAETFGISLNRYGFAKTEAFNPTATTRDGIFVAGVFQGPRDIPETVMNASAAAATAGGLLAQARGTQVRGKYYPPERDVSGEEPKVGVFVCRCGINIASVVDVPQVVEFARTIPGVQYVEENLYTCSQDTLKKIKEVIQEHSLNRVVVASCTIRTHQPLFREALREAGLNQFYFEMANIRDQCSWVHRNDPVMATEKAKDLLKMAVAKVKTHEALHLHPVPVVPKALIVGGGIAGMTAALTMSEQGYESYLIEREAQLGGFVRNLRRTLEGEDLAAMLGDTLDRVAADPKIHVYTNARIEDFSGHQGHFVTTISIGEGGKDHVRRTEQLHHGVVIIATGIQEIIPEKFCMGQDPRVITATQLEQQLFDGQWDGKGIKQVVMIQCAGSRQPDRQYCSRTCCAQSIKNALRIKEIDPNVEVYILYRDIRTYGFMEQYYREAREKGVVFVHYDENREPEVMVKETGMLEVTVVDDISSTILVLWPDQLVLASGTASPTGIQKFASYLKLPTNEDGFFVETHAKLGPIDFPSAGLFLCGGAHSPKFVSEAIYQAQGAVARACTVLSQENLMVGGVVAVVEEDKCAACLTCVRVCAYGVPKINARFKAEINAVQCHGCGTCVAECPGKAIQLQHYKDNQVLAKVAGLFQEVR